MHRCLLLCFVSLALVQTGALAQAPGGSKDPGSGTFIGGSKEKKEKAPTSRTLKGTVTDVSGKPLKGALVVLTNLNTNEKLNFFTKQDGRYNFADLSFTQDYQVIAKWKEDASPVRKMSQYDRRPNIVYILAVESANSNSDKPADAPRADSATH
jgi:hypothetical protein